MELRLESSVTINKPPSEVFAAWSEIERFAEWWDPVIERRKMTEGTVGVGTKYHAVDKMPPGRRLGTTLEIITYNPDDLIVGKLSGSVDGTWEARFQETDSGTQMNLHTTANLSGLLGVLGRLMSGWLQRIDQQALERFKASLEGTAT